MIRHNPTFSVIITTRNRPALFKVALNSVLEQENLDNEIIVVNDGAIGNDLDDYKKIEHDSCDRVRYFYLIRREEGHGPSYVRNYGVENSFGKYILFLDDDDEWVDRFHLCNIEKSIARYGGFDLYLANQYAVDVLGNEYFDLWISDISKFIKHKDSRSIDLSVKLTLEDLLKSSGFCHMNCFVICKKIFELAGGFDEKLRYEEDRDFYFRTIVLAKVIIFNSTYVSKHNIPVKANKNNASTVLSDIDKIFQRIIIDEKGIIRSDNSNLYNKFKLSKYYSTQNLVGDLLRCGRYRTAIYYSFIAFITKPSLRSFLKILHILFLVFIKVLGVKNLYKK